MSVPPDPAPVKPRRRYESRLRREQAARTRRAIVAAALDAFLEHGFAGATMQRIADAAGVVVETIYRTFGGKAALFEAAVEAAVAGGVERAERPPEQRPAILAVIDEPDPRRKVERYAETQPGIHARLGPLYRVLAEAAALDPDLVAVREQLEAQRLAGMGRFARHLADAGVLRPGLSVEEARDVLWTLCAHATYLMLVAERGWSPERYRVWLAEMLAAALLRR